jgi:thiol-disulfide isomerase/thioredoxin
MSSAQDPSYFLRSKYVTELTPKEFEGVATWKLKDKGCAVVLFYADWCPHCKAIQSEWEKLGQIATFCEVYAFNCAKYTRHLQKIKEDMPEMIKSFPTIIFYSNGEPVETYRGERTHANFLKACMNVCQRRK